MLASDVRDEWTSYGEDGGKIGVAFYASVNFWAFGIVFVSETS